MTTTAKDAVSLIRFQLEADANSLSHAPSVDRSLLEIVLAAAERAEEIEGLVMGQAYQIVGQLFAALDDPSLRPSPADEDKVLNYLAAGSYQESFLPWPGEGS